MRMTSNFLKVRIFSIQSNPKKDLLFKPSYATNASNCISCSIQIGLPTQDWGLWVNEGNGSWLKATVWFISIPYSFLVVMPKKAYFGLSLVEHSERKKEENISSTVSQQHSVSKCSRNSSGSKQALVSDSSSFIEKKRTKAGLSNICQTRPMAWGGPANPEGRYTLTRAGRGLKGGRVEGMKFKCTIKLEGCRDAYLGFKYLGVLFVVGTHRNCSIERNGRYVFVTVWRPNNFCLL